MEVPWEFWAIFGVALLVVEIVTPGVFVALCFAVGAFVAALVRYLGISSDASGWVFVAASFVAVLAARPAMKRAFHSGLLRSNVDELILAEGELLVRCSESERGSVKLNGELWGATSAEPIEVGTRVRAIRVEGTRVFVEPVADSK